MTKDNLKIIAGKTIDEWKSEISIISDIMQKKGNSMAESKQANL